MITKYILALENPRNMAEVGMQQAIGRKQILVGEARYVPVVPKKEIDPSEKKYTQFLKEVFDVAEPVLYQEVGEQAAVQGELALLTGAELAKKMKPWEEFKKHQDWKRLGSELDFVWRGGKDVPHRLGRVFLNGVIEAGSFGVDIGSDTVINNLLNHGKKELKIPLIKKTIELSQENKYVLRDGLEFGSDKFIGFGANEAIKAMTKQKDVRYPSQLANVLSEMGNIATSLARWNRHDAGGYKKALNSMINPAFIEGTLRSIAAIPLFGAGVERVYAAMNEKLKNENGGLYLTYMVLSRMLYTKYGYATGGDEKKLPAKKRISSKGVGGRRR